MATARDWRGAIARISQQVYEDYGIDAGHPGIVPWFVSEAVVNIESKGENLEPNADGATGVMQVVPTGREAGYFKNITGDTPTTEKLREPKYNLAVGIMGLAGDKKDVERLGYPGWEYAAQYYYGGFSNGQPDDNKTDSFGTRAGDYRYRVTDYINRLSTLGPTLTKFASAGKWFDPNADVGFSGDPGTDIAIAGSLHAQDIPSPFAIFDGLKDTYNDVRNATEKLDDLVNIVTDQDTWVRVGIVVAGLAVLGVGMAAVIW